MKIYILGGFGTFAERNINTSEVAVKKLKSVSEAATILRTKYS